MAGVRAVGTRRLTPFFDVVHVSLDLKAVSDNIPAETGQFFNMQGYKACFYSPARRPASCDQCEIMVRDSVDRQQASMGLFSRTTAARWPESWQLHQAQCPPMPSVGRDPTCPGA
jgi:hypothetical protein